MDIDTQGLVMCARYGYPPNSLHYCGPPQENDLSDYIQTHFVDRGLINILEKFETLYPYLRLLATANNIKNPFHPRIVEAYWIGNKLLDAVGPKQLFRHLTDGLMLGKHIPYKNRLYLDSLAEGFPHHTFHVLNIFVRMGHIHLLQTLETMDECRVRAGEITAVHSGGQLYSVRVRTLEARGNSLMLGKEIDKTATAIEKYMVGDTVAIHWGHICDKLNQIQRRNLHLATQKSIQYANAIHVVDKIS